MLNKIKIIGKVCRIKLKEKNETKNLLVRFSLLVINPNGVKTILCCRAGGEMANKIAEEVKEEEILEVVGYLRNERESRQVIIQLTEFIKLEKIEENTVVNKARLLGEIVEDLRVQQKEGNGGKLLSFKIKVPVKENQFSYFFCQAQTSLAEEIVKNLKRRDIILLEGFLQTKKIIPEENTQEEKKIVYVSSFICQTFILLDTSSSTADNFYSWEKITPVSREIEIVDFLKPKN